MTTSGGWAQPLLMLATVVARVGAAFFFVPFLSPKLVPTLVRISIMVCLAAWLAACGRLDAVASGAPGSLLVTLLRETGLGLLLGFVFSGVLWAYQIAGEFIDSKVGGAGALATDAFSGDQSGVHATLMLRYAGVVFASCGGLSALCHVLVESYQAWPLGGGWPLDRRALEPFTRDFGALMTAALMIAAPALTLLTLVEAGMGLVNRAAPRLNVFGLSLAIKGWLASLIILLMLQRLGADIFSRAQGVDTTSLERLRGLLG